MQTISYLAGTAPANLVVVQGVGRSLNPTDRSQRGNASRALSGREYDNKTSRHMNGVTVNSQRTVAFDTPVRVFRKNTGWMTVSGGRDGLSTTFAPDAVVVYASIEKVNKETREVETIIVQGITLREYQDTYC